jgi:tetratricopeptide (TPR) repeat protein
MKLTAKGYVHRAGLRCRKGDRFGALADLDRAIDLDPSMATGYFARGDLKRVGGDPDGAIADLTIAIQLNPNFPRAYVSRGNAHRNKGEANAAVADFNKAIRLDAKSALAYIGRGMARLPAGTAIRDFNRAIRLDPKSPEAFFGRGWAHFSRGDAAGAISDLTRAIDLNPQHSVAFMFRGEAYRDKGETDRAIADLTEAIRLGVPDWGYAYGQRGVERLRKGDFKGALVDLTKSIESHSKQPSRSGATDAKLAALYLSRGTALLGSGDARSSISDLNFAVRMDPSLKRLARPLLNSAQQQSSKPRKPRAAVAPKRSKASRQPRASEYSSAFLQWERSFRAEARADDFACFRRLLEQLKLETFTPKQVLEGTIELVRSSLVYSSGLDGRPFLPFLQLQHYNPSQSPPAYYTFTFDIHTRGIGRLLDTRKFEHIDLADLYGHPFEKYKLVGFSDLWILRADYSAFVPSELRRIERYVRDDLYFDYGEDEIDVCVRTEWADRVLVQVQDRLDS